MNKDQFSGERTKVVSFKSMETFKLRLLTSEVFVVSFMLRNTDSQDPGNAGSLALGVLAGVILALRMSVLEFTTSF